MRPSTFSGVQDLFFTQEILSNVVDPFLDDIRLMLRLPYGLTRSGYYIPSCEVPIVSSILSLVAGLSVCLYNFEGRIGLATKGDRGKRFKRVLYDYYPWNAESIDRTFAISQLWSNFRNPLEHSLGLQRECPTVFCKSPSGEKGHGRLSAEQIEELEVSEIKPKWLTEPMLEITENGLFLNIVSLYWGSNRLLYRLLGDRNQMDHVEDQHSKDATWTENRLSKCRQQQAMILKYARETD